VNATPFLCSVTERAKKMIFLSHLAKAKSMPSRSNFLYRPVNTWEKVLVLVSGRSLGAIFFHNREQFSVTVLEKFNLTISIGFLSVILYRILTIYQRTVAGEKLQTVGQ